MLLFRNTKPKNQIYSGPIENVILKLKWLNQAQFAGNYVAIEKGFFKQEGFNVKLKSFSFASTPVDDVSSGKATFGIAGAAEVLLARAKGIPVKAIAVIYKINPAVAFSLKTSGITKPQDFIGKTVGIEGGLGVNKTDVGIS